MLNKRKKIVIWAMVFIILVGIYIISNHKEHAPILITDNMSFKISDDGQNIYYKETESGTWKLLLNVSDDMRDILDVILDVILSATNPSFNLVKPTADKNKIVISYWARTPGTSDNDDYISEEDYIYNLRDGTWTDLPGNIFIGLSSNRKFILTALDDSDAKIPLVSEGTDFYVVNVETGDIVFAMYVDANGKKLGDLVSEIANSLHKLGIVLDAPTAKNLSKPHLIIVD